MKKYKRSIFDPRWWEPDERTYVEHLADKGIPYQMDISASPRDGSAVVQFKSCFIPCHSGFTPRINDRVMVLIKESGEKGSSKYYAVPTDADAPKTIWDLDEREIEATVLAKGDLHTGQIVVKQLSGRIVNLRSPELIAEKLRPFVGQTVTFIAKPSNRSWWDARPKYPEIRRITAQDVSRADELRKQTIEFEESMGLIRLRYQGEETTVDVSAVLGITANDYLSFGFLSEKKKERLLAEARKSEEDNSKILPTDITRAYEIAFRLLTVKTREIPNREDFRWSDLIGAGGGSTTNENGTTGDEEEYSYVICDNCGTRNEIPEGTKIELAHCGKCDAILLKISFNTTPLYDQGQLESMKYWDELVPLLKTAGIKVSGRKKEELIQEYLEFQKK